MLAGTAAADTIDHPLYRFVRMGGGEVAWAVPAPGATLEISYALVDRPLNRPGATNCEAMVPVPGGTQAALDLLGDVRRAMAGWQAGANVRFVPAADPSEADLLIGMQAEPQGIAFTDLILAAEPLTPARRGISRSAICFNPELAWETGPFDGDPATPSVFYVALHEVGHVLGLDHVFDDGSVMNFRNLERLDAPQPPDIAGVQALYGKPAMAVAAE